MKAKLFTLFLTLIISVATLFAVNGRCGNNLTWDLTDGVLIISGSGDMTTWESVLDIPWESYRNSITSVIIGDSVTSIGSQAFSSCSGLTFITIPNSVTSIGRSAFYRCTGLTSITIPNSVTSIGDRAFSYCSGLTFITIPNSVTSIGDWAFSFCNGLTEFIVPNANCSVGVCVLVGCSNMTSIKGPAGILHMHDDYLNVYDISRRLQTIEITGGEMTENALSVINRSYKTLKKLDVSAATNSEFADEAFKGYYNLDTLLLPANLQRISYMMVAGCKNLQSFTITASVEEIEQSAFEDCRSLTSISFAENPALTKIGNWAFYNCHQLSQITIPEGVAEIGDAAFYGCVYVQSLQIPASVQSMGDNAFALCSRITRMDVDAVLPPAVDDKTFFEVSTEAPVYVPDESVNTYKAHPVWGRLNIIAKSEAPSAIENVSAIHGESTKILRNGQILILRGDKIYTVTGQEVK